MSHIIENYIIYLQLPFEDIPIHGIYLVVLPIHRVRSQQCSVEVELPVDLCPPANSLINSMAFSPPKTTPKTFTLSSKR